MFQAGQPYAEIEVMKMYMPLLATESGIIKFLKSPGSTLQSGDVIGQLILDDPTKVKKIDVFDSPLPNLG